MVLDDQDRDTWSVGSFFVNPVVSEEIARSLPAACPVFGAPGGMKVSAAWLIANSGIECGFRLPQSGARVSTKHTLAICNANDATCQDILDMAREIRSRVRATFGIELVPEPRLVGCRL